MPEDRARRGFAPALAGIALAALALRLAWGALRGGERFFAEGYTLFFTLARQLAAGHGYAFPGQPPTAFRVPLYPLFLAGLTGGEPTYAPVLVAQALVSSGTMVLAGLLAREWFGARAGLLAAALCAIYPYHVLHDVTLQETGLFTFLAALATWLALSARRRGSVPLAAPRHGILGDAVHALSFFPILLLALAMQWHRRRQWREDVPVHAHLALFAAITAVLWAQTSHRSYLDVYLIVFAAGMLDRLWAGRRDGEGRSTLRQ